MPWAKVDSPSLGLSILQATCSKNDINANVNYFSQRLLKYIRHDTYSVIADAWGLNDFIFSAVFEPEIDEIQMSNLLDICKDHHYGVASWRNRFKSIAEAVDVILIIRNTIIPKYLDECAQILIKKNPDGIGFTCLYDQTLSSLALAYTIKKIKNVPIALGGYSVAGDCADMLVKSFSCIDVIIEGDGEESIIQWARSIQIGNNYSDVYGAVFFFNGVVRRNNQKKINIDDSPSPDFNDFFGEIEKLNKEDNVQINNTYLPVESSRGCWWGQKSHCTFCGIDEETLKYRSKSPENVYKMLTDLRLKYGIKKKFSFIDYIIPHTYYKTLFNELSELTPPLYLTCEMKANVNAVDMLKFKSAGFKELQPGIESFSSNILKKMDKGVSAPQNILTLKLGKINGIIIHYNILYGFPVEELSDYQKMVVDIPLLYHLDPPISCLNVLITKNAPLQRDYLRFGYLMPKPSGRYDVIFSQAFSKRKLISWDEYAYVFERTYSINSQLRKCFKIIDSQVDIWKKKSVERQPRLTYIQVGKTITFQDTRFSITPVIVTIEGLEATLYQLCDTKVYSYNKALKETGRTKLELNSAIDKLDSLRLIFRENDKFVGLGIGV